MWYKVFDDVLDDDKKGQMAGRTTKLDDEVEVLLDKTPELVLMVIKCPFKWSGYSNIKVRDGFTKQERHVVNSKMTLIFLYRTPTTKDLKINPLTTIEEDMRDNDPKISRIKTGIAAIMTFLKENKLLDKDTRDDLITLNTQKNKEILPHYQEILDIWQTLHDDKDKKTKLWYYLRAIIRMSNYEDQIKAMKSLKTVIRGKKYVTVP